MEDDHLIDALLEGWDDVMDGAAMQSAEQTADLEAVPRVMRYAILGVSSRSGTARQLAAEIIEVAPEASDATRAWLAKPRLANTLALAGALDRLSVETARPVLRSLADCVRIVALPVPAAGRSGAPDYMRVARALSLARKAMDDEPDDLRASADRAILAWAVAPLLADLRVRSEARPAIVAGSQIIDELTEAMVMAATSQARSAASSAVAPSLESVLAGGEAACPAGHAIVCQRDIDGPIAARANDVIRPHIHVINTPVPLVACPDLRPVRTALVQEFPYAEAVVDFLLAGLVGRPHVRFEPLLLVGEPGGGKTRFVRRACELLNVGVARIDATQADGSACAGTDKRWSTASPSAPFLAISRFQHGNPVLLVDEIDKAATRSDYGRLWDVLVSLCERENTTRYPDPGLGSEVDISHASYIATANATSMLPAPLLDRFRRVEFPQPRVQDLDVLVHSFRHEIATDRGLDPRFFPPLAPAERRLVLKQWGGGSVRRLRRLCEVVFRSREKLFLVQ